MENLAIIHALGAHEFAVAPFCSAMDLSPFRRIFELKNLITRHYHS